MAYEGQQWLSFSVTAIPPCTQSFCPSIHNPSNNLHPLIFLSILPHNIHLSIRIQPDGLWPERTAKEVLCPLCSLKSRMLIKGCLCHTQPYILHSPIDPSLNTSLPPLPYPPIHLIFSRSSINQLTYVGCQWLSLS